MLAVLDGPDQPAAKIEKIKGLLPSQADAASDEEVPETENVDRGETQ